jgi:hypothetical protein
MRKIDIIDERGMYLYSWMFEVSGENLELMAGKDIGSMAGEPRRISVYMEYPNIVASNPSRVLSNKKQYKVIIVESELVN